MLDHGLQKIFLARIGTERPVLFAKMIYITYFVIIRDFGFNSGCNLILFKQLFVGLVFISGSHFTGLQTIFCTKNNKPKQQGIVSLASNQERRLLLVLVINRSSFGRQLLVVFSHPVYIRNVPEHALHEKGL